MKCTIAKEERAIALPSLLVSTPSTASCVPKVLVILEQMKAPDYALEQVLYWASNARNAGLYFAPAAGCHPPSKSQLDVQTHGELETDALPSCFNPTGRSRSPPRHCSFWLNELYPVPSTGSGSHGHGEPCHQSRRSPFYVLASQQQAWGGPLWITLPRSLWPAHQGSQAPASRPNQHVPRWYSHW